jgi:hypothetical protein
MTSPPIEAHQSSSGGRAVTSRHAILIPSSTETPECLPDIHEGPPKLAESNGRRGRAPASTVVRRAIKISLNFNQKTRQSHRNNRHFEGFFIHRTRSNPWGCGNGFFVHSADSYHNRLWQKNPSDLNMVSTLRCVETIINTHSSNQVQNHNPLN